MSVNSALPTYLSFFVQESKLTSLRLLPSVLPVDRRAERAPRPRDEQRIDAQRAGDPPVYGDQAPPPGPGERRHTRQRPGRPETSEQLQLLLRLQSD